MLSILKQYRRPLLAICLWAALLLLLYGLPLLDSRPPPCAIEQQGGVDLSRCSFDKKEPIALEGRWQFYPNQFLYMEGAEPNASIGSTYVDVPHRWNTSNWPLFHNKVQYATYKLKLKLPEKVANYAIRLVNVKTASQVFVDGKLVGQRGKVGATFKEAESYNQPYTVYFSAASDEVELLLQVSNFDFNANRGISEAIYIGSPESIHHYEKRQGFFDIILISCLLFMGLYFFGEHIHRRDGRSPIYFPLFCLFGVVYFASHGEKLLMEWLPHLPNEVFVKIQMLSSMGVSYFFLIHIYTQLKPYASAWLVRALSYYTAGIALFLIIVPTAFYTQFMYALLLVNLFGLAYIILISLRAVQAGMEGSFYILISVLAAMQVIVMMVAKAGWIGYYNNIPPIGILVFVLAQGLFFSSRFSNAYEQIKQLSQQLMNKMKEQEQFLVRTSHELKTPLNAIMNISQSMIEGAGGRLNAAQESDLKLVNSTAHRLSHLVKDILDAEQLKNERIRLYPKVIDIYPVVSVIVDIFRHLNMKQELQIMNEVRADEHFVVGDENRLSQILYNLLDNALKHTEAGSIRIVCEHREGFEAVSVIDTGVGIAEDQWNSIFTEYKQVERSSYTDTSGIGIGLPIAKQLVERQGGDMRVRSVLGAGSTFTFTLPAASRSDQGEAALMNSTMETLAVRDIAAGKEREPLDEEAATSRAAAAYQGHVLLVDDSYPGLKALKNLLTLDGYTCDAVTSGEAALELLKHGNPYNLCIMDVMMPKMSGFELCRLIRQSYHSLELPVLMATAGANFQLNKLGFESGANDFIHKPYDWTDLRGRVRTLVELKATAAKLVHSERDMLRAQIKPHFLFNAINTILWMSKRDPEETRKLLYHLSDFLRGSFDFDNHDAEVPFSDELQLIEAYLSLERARFGERLQVKYDLEAKEFDIPALLLQPIVENAVRHGLMEKVEGGTVMISSRRSKDWIEIMVADDGVGISLEHLHHLNSTAAYAMPDRSRKGIGLDNINRRLRSLYGTTLQIERRDGGGTKVSMFIRAGKENK
ncbi:hybrid sensor histidine kinase/response regulator [Paenibacillus aquistagni]|uniref:hybrid sensor histidine kinase/response regulator n=1 Tax=Paenibacillus aquistagni TaxID=1852522 RepID=UPI001482EF3E|nr:ATP-binding protein [Paenibacillus aquistagni]